MYDNIITHVWGSVCVTNLHIIAGLAWKSVLSCNQLDNLSRAIWTDQVGNGEWKFGSFDKIVSVNTCPFILRTYVKLKRYWGITYLWIIFVYLIINFNNNKLSSRSRNGAKFSEENGSWLPNEILYVRNLFTNTYIYIYVVIQGKQLSRNV